jgi:hypothetical protein
MEVLFWEKCVRGERLQYSPDKEPIVFERKYGLVNELFFRTGALCCTSHIALYFLELNLKSDCSDGTVCIVTLEVIQTKLCVVRRRDCSGEGILCCILFSFMVLYCS